MKPQPKPVTAADVRARFPEPKTSLEVDFRNEHDRYCVGGAFCLAQGAPWTFPQISTLAEHLAETNPALNLGNYGNAFGFASLIVRRNDAQDFEGAWRALDAALSAGPYDSSLYTEEV